MTPWRLTMKDKLATPPFQLALLAALVGAGTPVLALLRNSAAAEALHGTDLVAVIWGLSPFALVPVLAWIARRPFSRWTVALLAALAAGFGLLAHFGGVSPQAPNSTTDLRLVFVPAWQWPMILLSALVALVAPPPAPPTETGNSEETL